MSLAPSFSELAEQLDEAVAAVDHQSLTAEEAAKLLPAFSSLQRHLDTFVSFAEARIEADNVRFLDQRPRPAEVISQAVEAEEAVYSAAEFAMVSGDYYGANDVVRSTWDDGTEFEWVGSQCIVNHKQ
jgi:hypothetical protein